MPNLFSDLPVEILWWVLASTSGLTRSAMRAVWPARGGERRQHLELGLRLHVEAEDVLVQPVGDLARGLADAGEVIFEPARRRRGRGAARLPKPRPCRCRAGPACAARPGSSSPSWHSRPARARPRTRWRTPCSAAPAWRWSSSRTACRPRGRSRAGRHSRRASRRRDNRNGAWPRLQRIGSRMKLSFARIGLPFLRCRRATTAGTDGARPVPGSSAAAG